MTGLLFFIVVIALIVMALIYDFVRNARKIASLEKTVRLVKAELKKENAAGERLQQELAETGLKLQRTMSDPVTELLGWQLFEDRLHQSIKECERYQLTLGVMFVDIDDFKVINDALSYEIGDMLLAEVGRRLQSCIRQVDSISRFSKDTFVVSLTQLNKPEAAAVVAQRMLQSLTQPFLIKDQELFITACIGIAVYPTDGLDVSTLLRNADHALHLAKEKGHHLYQFYQERLHAESQRELALNTHISRDTIFNEFVLYYQPIVNVVTQEIIGMDALLYWQHPDLGLIKPQELFTLASRQRRMNAITEWWLRKACEHYLTWQLRGFKPTLLAVPLCLKQLENTNFIYRISQVLQELNFNSANLLLEIKSEKNELNKEVLEKAFNMLEYLRMNIALSDFGTNNISLTYLKDFSIHYIKLDASLIADIETNSRTTTLLKSMVTFAKEVGIELIVQGVQKEGQLTKLKEIGCALMQGDALSPALTQQEVAEKLVLLTQ